MRKIDVKKLRLGMWIGVKYDGEKELVWGIITTLPFNIKKNVLMLIPYEQCYERVNISQIKKIGEIASVPAALDKKIVKKTVEEIKGKEIDNSINSLEVT